MTTARTSPAGSVLLSHVLHKDANFSAFMLNVLDCMKVGLAAGVKR